MMLQITLEYDGMMLLCGDHFTAKHVQNEFRRTAFFILFQSLRFISFKIRHSAGFFRSTYFTYKAHLRAPIKIVPMEVLEG